MGNVGNNGGEQGEWSVAARGEQANTVGQVRRRFETTAATTPTERYAGTSAQLWWNTSWQAVVRPTNSGTTKVRSQIGSRYAECRLVVKWNNTDANNNAANSSRCVLNSTTVRRRRQRVMPHGGHKNNVTWQMWNARIAKKQQRIPYNRRTMSYTGNAV